ncbi:taste receptor type 2 member 9-like [Leptodactylus fuscus]|uniref:taste receptor type 2 member 9-like n=1 Tax=Leptodactylus fuscus TaxID=238119 RepID=UPI003F4EEE5A
MNLLRYLHDDKVNQSLMVKTPELVSSQRQIHLKLEETTENSWGQMTPFSWGSVFIFAVVECILGVLFNSYIIMQNVVDWRQGRRLSLCDQILVLMAVNNICLQCDMNVATFLYIVFPEMVQYKDTYSTLSVFLIFQFYFSFWVTAGLCIFYCLRIVSFKHRLFVRLKMNISDVISRFLTLAAVGSFGLSALSIWHVKVGPTSQNVNVSTGIFMNNVTIVFSPTYKVLTILVGCCLPFVLTLLSILLTLSSLISHIWRMRNNKAGVSIPRLDAHIRAARIMVLLTVLYAEFYVSEICLLASTFSLDNFWEFLSLVFVLIYPTAQSSTIILGHSKLRPSCLRRSCCTGHL